MSADNYILINRKNFVVKELNASDAKVLKKIGQGKKLNIVGEDFFAGFEIVKTNQKGDKGD